MLTRGEKLDLVHSVFTAHFVAFTSVGSYNPGWPFGFLRKKHRYILISFDTTQHPLIHIKYNQHMLITVIE